ncbi:uncharacterized protein LOC125052216 [Pieris napi]|uniref:uncharacterized protein LOC125052216 n=1 Tax=Pieris napi TaxID=78633 RepID=UPI001FBBF085|nr:uncharacterized protein LOC125052216 [Pieris napi]
MTHAYYADAWKKTNRRQRVWYTEHLMPALLAAKEKRVRDIDTLIAMTQELIDIYNEPAAKSKPVSPRVVEQSDDLNLMKPIEPEVLNLLYGSTEKGAAERYLKARYKKAPEDKFYFRVATNFDYGWQQKQGRVARDVNRGRCAILRDTFYRKNNLAPDPIHYSQPAGGEISICSQYSCHFN